MALTIKWRNRNPVDSFQGFELYRSTVKQGIFVAGNKIATLAPTVTEYVDADMNPGSSFYYGIRTLTLDGYYIDGLVNLISWPTEYGYGKTTLIAGSADLGIYEILLATDFPLAAGLNAALDRAGLYASLATNLLTSVTNDVTNKISYNGKVMFIPSGALLGFGGNSPVVASRNQYKAILAACNANQIYYDFLGERYYFKLATDVQMVTDVMAGSICEIAALLNKQINLCPPTSSATGGLYFLLGYDGSDKSITFGSSQIYTTACNLGTDIWSAANSSRYMLPFYAVPGGPI